MKIDKFVFILIFLFGLTLFSCPNPIIEPIFGVRTILFNTGGGSEVQEQKLLRGETITRPDNPTRSNFLFLGWFASPLSVTQWNFNTVPDTSMTLFAKWEIFGEVVSPSPIFLTAEVNYDFIEPQTVTIMNIGLSDIGPFEMSISGTYADKFMLSADQIQRINAGGEDYFTVTPVLDLPVHNYVAVINITGADMSANINVNFVVTNPSTNPTVFVKFDDSEEQGFDTLDEVFELFEPDSSYAIRIIANQEINANRILPENSVFTMEADPDYGTVIISLTNPGRLITIPAGSSLAVRSGIAFHGRQDNTEPLVYVDGGSFTLAGGTVAENHSTGNGGGVYVASGTFTMTGGLITANSANNGGGVYIESGIFYMIQDDGIISRNNAINGYGGGIYISNDGNLWKSIGIVYGIDDDENRNAAINADNELLGNERGHAAYHASDPPKTRTETQDLPLISESTGVGWDLNMP
ncbi:MAG: InlB B-repeat-containing protein [Treponema sp.]|nr:InlB B-repeat-containing protein [Treponema sp.]MCL2237384.1 InlB B-repeat-containing protein [Treponema sp.]